jgi:hypothetical protein
MGTMGTRRTKLACLFLTKKTWQQNGTNVVLAMPHQGVFFLTWSRVDCKSFAGDV